MQLLEKLPENWQIWKSIEEDVSELGIKQVGIIFDTNQENTLLEISNPEIISGDSPTEMMIVLFRDEDIPLKGIDFLYDGGNNGIFHAIKKEEKKISFRVSPEMVRYLRFRRSISVKKLV